MLQKSLRFKDKSGIGNKVNFEKKKASPLIEDCKYIHYGLIIYHLKFILKYKIIK